MEKEKPMTVKDLIEKLKNVPPDAEVSILTINDPSDKERPLVDVLEFPGKNKLILYDY